MAPEIIELSGASFASDIWSLGCTVIELLTGKPPYYDLDQMSALFRIVQDDCPPLPDGISSGCKDFLVQCFQKQPVLRTSAKNLLKHRWIAAHKRNSTFKFGDQTQNLIQAAIQVNGFRRTESLPPLPDHSLMKAQQIVQQKKQQQEKEQQQKAEPKKESPPPNKMMIHTNRKVKRTNNTNSAKKSLKKKCIPD